PRPCAASRCLPPAPPSALWGKMGKEDEGSLAAGVPTASSDGPRRAKSRAPQLRMQTARRGEGKTGRRRRRDAPAQDLRPEAVPTPSRLEPRRLKELALPQRTQSARRRSAPLEVAGV